MKTRKFLNKIIVLVLVFAMLIPTTISNFGTNVKEVQAADATSQVTDESVGYVIIPKGSVNTEGSQPTVFEGYADNKYSDYLFAGWYSDDKALTASADGNYARFVPADVLSIKCQVTRGIVTDTLIDEYENKYVLRFLTSVDSLDYKNAGFVITYEENGKTITRTNTTTKGLERIESTTGSTGSGADTYEYSPKVISTKSEYFVTAKWPLVDTDQNITVKAFWTTKDGQRVYGGSRCVSVSDGLEGASTTNLSFQSTHQYTGSIDVTYGESNTATATVIGQTENSDGTYTIHTRVNVKPDSLACSVTTFTFAHGETAIYRNLLTQYTGTVERTWYDVNTNADEFVIASSADLYGLAAVVNGGETFAKKTVYVVADIKANKGKATETGWSAAATNGTSYIWTPIGQSTAFAGTFDGQMHTISGIRLETKIAGSGLFGKTAANSYIRNLQLINSYFCSNNKNFGSIIGVANGHIDNVYSDAFVTGSDNDLGGLYGFAGESSGTMNMTNCWFNGVVTNTGESTQYTGGLIGYAYKGSIILNDCMNSGTVDATANNGSKAPGQGGLIGGTASASATITDCLNVGMLEVSSRLITKAYGAIAGLLGANITIKTTYADKSKFTGETKSLAIGYAEGITTTLVDANGKEESFTGSSGHGNVMKESASLKGTPLAGFDFDNKKTWTVVANDTPILTSFEDVIINPDTSWINEAEGTAQDPYILYDRNDLYGFAKLSQTENFAEKTIRLGADIVVNKGNANDWDELEPQYNWTPIGSAGKPFFAGTFDGSDPETGKIHTISGIYLNTTKDCSGLFSTTAIGSTVKNFKLKNSYFTTTNKRFGSVVGFLMGDLDTIYSDAIVEGNNQAVGGMVGIVGNSTKTEVAITNCWFDGTVTNKSIDQGYTGGLVGHVHTKTLTLTDCLNSGTVDATAYTKANKNGVIAPYVGGLVGYHGAGTLTVNTSVNTGKVKYSSAASDGRGAIVGYANGSSAPVNMSGVYYIGKSCTWLCPGAKIPVENYIKVDDVSAETWENLKETYWVKTAGQLPRLKTFASGVIIPDTTWYDANANTYVLYNAADLYGFAKLSQTENFAGKTIQLGADIVVNKGDSKEWAQNAPKYKWTPIGTKSYAFAGIFDGSDPETGKIYSISGLYLNNSSSEGNGLFGYVSTGTIKNIKLINSYFYSEVRKLGSIAGEIGAAKLDTLYSDAIVVSAYAKDQAFAGGLVGIAGNSGNADVDITNCWFAGTVTNNNSTRDIGGLVGWAYTNTLDIENCMNTGIINAPNTTYPKPRVGGFVGYNQVGTLAIKNSIHNAPINCPQRANCTVGLNQATLKLTGVYYGGYSYVYSNDGGDITNATGYTKIKSGTDYSVLTNTDAWVTVDTYYTMPALNAFPYNEVTPSATTYRVEAETVQLVGATDDPSYSYAQGGCYAEESDGNYFYQAYLTYRDESDENNNTVVIVKYDLEGNKISQSPSLSLNHANDMTYNSNTGKLIVCHESGAANKISIIDPTNNWAVESKELIFNMYCIDYDAIENKYVVGISESHNIYILDENFNVIECYTNVKTEPKTITPKGPQGMCCDEQYIYYLYLGNNEHAITVFDWEGNYIKDICFTQSGEPENISVVDGKIYVSFVRKTGNTAVGATLYTLTPQQ